MGQLHLEIAVERLASEHRVAVRASPPKVAYRSTVRNWVRQAHRHVKQTGGPGQWAHVVIELGPAERGAGLLFEDHVHGGAIPREFVAAVQKGVTDAASAGVVAGYPVTDVVVRLVDGATHAQDSSELAFKVAGEAAFKVAAKQAAPCLLEPWMTLEVVAGEADIGTVVADLQRRRGRVQSLDVRADGDVRVLKAVVPLAEAFGYAGALSGLTHGRGRFTLEPTGYEPVPNQVAARLAL
jgi:elongation factor G